MKLKTLAYSAYMVLSLLFSLTFASVPAILFFWFFYQNIDSIITGFGGLLDGPPVLAQALLGDMLPLIVYEKFYFFTLLVPISLFCYGLFLGVLLGFFKLSARGIPFLEDGYYPMESEDWLLYEYRVVYYNLFPYFAWFFSIFLDTKPRHMLFGAKIGKATVVGNGRLFNPERTIIGDECFFGYDAIMSGHVYEGDRLYLKTVEIGNNVTVGANAVILAGAEIGDNVIIGANTVVPKNKVIPPNTIWIHGKAIPRKAVSPVSRKYEIINGQAELDSDEAEDHSAEIPEEGEHI
ncbi:hypothetical protein EU537_09980 [Candidatus Thorarchaeota archaeon]|nr:MAG: hypothetical protein EU537_09980 [Candidatus Thorarchaeota archaeon]